MTARRPWLGPVVVRDTRPYLAADPSLHGDHHRSIRAAVIRYRVARVHARRRARLFWCRR